MNAGRLWYVPLVVGVIPDYSIVGVERCEEDESNEVIAEKSEEFSDIRLAWNRQGQAEDRVPSG